MTTDITFASFERIYPTENDVAFSSYNGVNGSEVNYTKNLFYRNPKNAILAELDGGSNPTNVAGFVASIGAGLSVNITRGRAYIEGRYLELISTTPSYNVALLPATQDTYIYLTLNIAGVVQTAPPARFTTVSVAIDAGHTRPQNSVPICMARTNATNVIYIEDLRPSQICDTVYFNIETTPAIIPPALYTQVGLIDIGDIHFTKTLCGYFFTNPGPTSGDTIDIIVRATGFSTFVENTLSQPFNITHPSQIARGFVNIPSSLRGYGKLQNIFSISYRAIATGFVIGVVSPQKMTWKLKEWNAKG